MKARTVRIISLCSITAASLLIAAYKAEWLAAAVFAVLFVFVWFDHWRGKIYRALLRLTRKKDVCDSNDHGT